MLDPFGRRSGELGSEASKSRVLAETLNRLIQDVILRCAKEEGVRDYFHIGVIGYGEKVDSLLGPGSEPSGTFVLTPISVLAEQPLRLEKRVRHVADGAGGIVERSTVVPVWIDPHAKNGTPMCHALALAHEAVLAWIDGHPDAFPPVIVNITDGESTDGDPLLHADKLRREGTSDGEVLLFNIHLSESEADPILFPDSLSRMPDAYARLLYRMSSPLPSPIRDTARHEGFKLGPDARGFLFNADPSALVRFLEIGTRPANLR